MQTKEYLTDSETSAETLTVLNKLQGDVESIEEAEAAAEYADAKNNFERLVALSDSLDSVLEIKDNKQCAIALTAVLAGDDLEPLRPSLESAEDAQDASKGTARKVIDYVVETARSFYKALVKFIKKVMARFGGLEAKVASFHENIGDLKGVPKKDKITLPPSTALLFNKHGLKPNVLNERISKKVMAIYFTFRNEVMHADKIDPKLELDTFKEIGELTVEKGAVVEVPALTVKDITRASTNLAKDVDMAKFKADTKRELDEMEKVINAVSKVDTLSKEAGEDAKLELKKVKLCGSVLKGVLEKSAIANTAKLTALVAFAKNIGEPS